MAVLTAGAAAAPGQTVDPELDRLSEMSLEQLMSIPVISVAGVEREWFSTPAAIYVISAEDVRRSGHQTLADALRLAPGVFVGQFNAQAWSISPRGFNGGGANKTLVLIDGRPVYDPLFSGTFWGVQDILLEDLDRIEVIRGPGPTLWGANAVNGVINVTTRSAEETQGLYVTGLAGTELDLAAVRWGDELGDDAWYRVWSKYRNIDTMGTGPDGFAAEDDWSMIRGGFRADGRGADDGFWTLEGDVYDTPTLGEVIQVPVPNQTLVFERSVSDGRTSGGHLLGRIGQDHDARRGWWAQAFYDRTERVTNEGFRAHRDTVAAAFQHYFEWGDRHELIWGADLHHTHDRTDPGPNTAADPRSRGLTTFDAFVQDTITLIDEQVFVMLGSKFGVNDFTGFEVQPSARLWWTRGERHTLWTAVTRAVRIPSRLESDAIFTLGYVDTGLAAGGPASGVFIPLELYGGGDDLDSEVLWAYEAGYRWRPADRLTFDTAIFFNDYDRLISIPPSLVGMINNAGEAETYGAEVVATWQVAPSWRVETSYSYVDVQVHGPVLPGDEGSTPHHQAQIRSYLDLTEDLELNSALYYVDRVPEVDVDAYLRWDVGLTWRPSSNVEFAIWGQNLLDAEHREYQGNEVERAFYVQATLRF